MQDRKRQNHRSDPDWMTIVDLWPHLTPYQRSMLTIHALTFWISTNYGHLRPRHLVLPAMFCQLIVFLIAISMPLAEAIVFGTIGNILIAALAISPSIGHAKPV